MKVSISKRVEKIKAVITDMFSKFRAQNEYKLLKLSLGLLLFVLMGKCSNSVLSKPVTSPKLLLKVGQSLGQRLGKGGMASDKETL